MSDSDATYRQVEDQLAAIKREVEDDPLLSNPEPLTENAQIVTAVRHDAVFLTKALSLFRTAGGHPAKYRRIRYARRDGNCFFRCASFRLLELMMSSPSFVRDSIAQVRCSTTGMISHFGEYSEDFAQPVIDLMERIQAGTVSTTEALSGRVLSGDAPFIIVFFRYAVSLYLRNNADDFTPFIMGLGYDTVASYCTAEVEPVDHESDNVQLVAFAKLFKVQLVVEMMDRSPGEVTNSFVVVGADGECPKIHLVYRPGHYDLLEE